MVIKKFRVENQLGKEFEMTLIIPQDKGSNGQKIMPTKDHLRRMFSRQFPKLRLIDIN